MRETDVEKAITDYLRFALPRDAVSFHVPNGGFKLSPWEIGMLKRAGWIAGIPDRCILWNGKAYFIETKTKHGRANKDQKEMRDRIINAGINVDIARTVEQVEDLLIRWGIPINARLRLA